MPNEDKIFDDAPVSGQNDFGGDNFESEPSTPEDRGDDFEPDETAPDVDEAEVDDDAAADEAAEADAEDDVADADDAESTDEDEGAEDSDDNDGVDEDEDDADEDDADEDDKPEEKVKGKVPRGRLNKEIEKRKALEAQIKALQAQTPSDVERDAPAAPAKTLSKEQFIKMQNAMLDGDTDQGFEAFVEMLNEQAATVREATLAEVEEKVDSTVNSRTAQTELSREAEAQAKRFPELDSESEYADEGLIEEVVEIRDVYAAQGISPAEALRKAVRLVSVENELVDRTAKRDVKPAPKEKKVDMTEKLELAKREKGKLAGDSNKTKRPKIDVSKMSDSEFARLSAEAKARARGDFV